MPEYEDEIERKFLVESFEPDCEWPVPFTESVILQTYLSNGDGLAERVRKRHYVDEDRVEYTHNVKVYVGPGHFKESECEIDFDEYDAKESRQDPKTDPVRKIRKVFEWEGLTWELDVYQEPAGFVILEVELQDAFYDPLIKTPPFIKIDREVTGIEHWSNRAMAAVSWSGSLKLVAGQVWIKGGESFQVLSATDSGGIRAYEERRASSGPGIIVGPKLAFVNLEELLEDGWSLKGSG
jgi:CYTH domain-containing protein